MTAARTVLMDAMHYDERNLPLARRLPDRPVTAAVTQRLLALGYDAGEAEEYGASAGASAASGATVRVADVVLAQTELLSSEYERRYYVTDHLGSVRAVVNVMGWVVEARDYYAWGLEQPGRVRVGGAPAAEGYTGHELDAETGHYYAGARYYMPALGRWTSMDPRAEKYPAWSPYNYGLNNPLTYTDPGGDTVRVYTHTDFTGHAWISAGEADNMVVHTYGRYDGTFLSSGSPGSTPGSARSLNNGRGVLIRLEGEKAHSYNRENLAKEDGSVFNILDVADEDVKAIGDAIFNSSDTQITNEASRFYEDARVVDTYSLMDNNCSTFVQDLINEAGSSAMVRTYSGVGVDRDHNNTISYTARPIYPGDLERHLRSVSGSR